MVHVYLELLAQITSYFKQSSWCYISFYHQIYIKNTNLIKRTLVRMPVLLAPKRKRVIFVLNIVCPQYTFCFCLPDSGNCYFLVFQNACPNLTFTCPEQSGKCLCSTLQLCLFIFFCLLLLIQILSDLMLVETLTMHF